MLASFVGNVDIPAALVLIALVAATCIISCVWLGTHKSPLERDQAFELEKLKLMPKDKALTYTREDPR